MGTSKIQDLHRSYPVRVHSSTHRTLEQLAQQLNVPKATVLARAVEAYRRQLVLQQANEAYAALRADPREWDEEDKERRLWDTSMLDGLEDE